MTCRNSRSAPAKSPVSAYDSAKVVRAGAIGPELERPQAACPGLLRPALHLCASPMLACASAKRERVERAAKACGRFIEPPVTAQQAAEIIVEFGAVRIEGDRAAIRDQSFFGSAQRASALARLWRATARRAGYGGRARSSRRPPRFARVAECIAGDFMGLGVGRVRSGRAATARERLFECPVSRSTVPRLW